MERVTQVRKLSPLPTAPTAASAPERPTTVMAVNDAGVLPLAFASGDFTRALLCPVELGPEMCLVAPCGPPVSRKAPATKAAAAAAPTASQRDLSDLTCRAPARWRRSRTVAAAGPGTEAACWPAAAATLIAIRSPTSSAGQSMSLSAESSTMSASSELSRVSAGSPAALPDFRRATTSSITRSTRRSPLVLFVSFKVNPSRNLRSSRRAGHPERRGARQALGPAAGGRPPRCDWSWRLPRWRFGRRGCELEHRPLVRSEPVKRAEQGGAPVALHGQAVRARTRSRPLRDVTYRHYSRRSRPPPVAGQIGRDPQQVSRIRHAPVRELRKGPHGTQEHLLRQILGLGRIDCVPGERPVYRAPAAPTECFERALIAGPGQRKQRRVVWLKRIGIS